MANGNPVRKPQQKRSIEKKEKILEAGYRLFNDKGYYKTSTPEIAAEAGVSIGCLYSYFKDKHEIFMEIYTQYESNFNKIHQNLQKNFLSENPDPDKCFREFIEAMIKVHEESKGFQRELNVLYYSDPDVFQKRNEQIKEVQEIALVYLKQFQNILVVEDLEAASIISSDIISAIVDRISFYENSVERERILNEGVRAVCRYLFG